MSKVYGLMADLHLHAWSSFATTNPDGQNSRLVGLLDEISRCAREVHAAGGDRIIMAGDVFHVRGSVSPSVLNSARDRLCHLNGQFGTQFIIIPGNHDLEGRDSTRLSSAVTALESSYVQVVNEATYVKELRVALVPWFEDIAKLKATVEALGTGDMRKFFRENTDLILHAPIDGVIRGLPAHGLTPEWLAGLEFKRVAAGHYHNHKSFPGGVYSIGALAAHTWSDVGSKAGYLLVYPDRVDWRKSHLPEFIDLSQLAAIDPEDVPLLVDGNYVRVRVEASKVREVEAARKELLDMGAKGVIVQAQPKAAAREGSPVATVASGASLEVSVANYVKTLPGVSAAEVTKAALDVLSTIDSMKE